MNVVRLLLWAILAVLSWYLLGDGPGGPAFPVATLLGVLACVAGILILGWKGDRFSFVWMGDRQRVFRVAGWISLVVILLFWLGLATREPVRDLVWAWEQAFDPPPPAVEEDKGEGEQTTGHMDWNEGSRRALPRHTNIKPGKKPEVFLRIEDRLTAERMSKGPIYVSSIGYDRYEDSAWHIAAESPGEIAADASGSIVLDGQAAGGGVWHTVVMSADARRRSPLVSLQGLAKVEGFPAVERWSSCLYLLPQPEQPEKGYRYRAASVPVMLRELAGGDAQAGLQASADPTWLRVPQDALGKRISELAQTVAAGDSAQEKARRIESHLRGNYRYSLATANPRNLDPLENFLFDEKSGHCEYFATAGALMARAAGIPARVMYGWAGGTWYEYADWFVFRADEAHVWVELWMGERGWVVMDPTPPEALGAQRRSVAQEKMPVIPGLELEPAHPYHEEAPTPVLPWIVSLVLAGLALAVVLRPSRRVRDATDKRIIPEPWRARAATHYLDEWHRAAKPRLPRQSMGASTLRQQLRAMQPAPEFADELLGYHYQVRYEGRRRDRAHERKLTRRIRAWASETKK